MLAGPDIMSDQLPNPQSNSELMISSAMNNERLDSLIRDCAEVREGKLGFWNADYRDRLVMVITDESHNRMRIITPVVEITEVSEEIWMLALRANFDRALDARYAVNGEYLWSVYIHPFNQLSDAQFLDALDQVVTLADNFGTSFSSSDLVFGG